MKAKAPLKSGKARSSKLKQFTHYLAQHQIGFPLRIIAPVLIGYLFRFPYFDKLIFISNERPDGRFEKSLWDIPFLLFYICVFTVLRALAMTYILIPLAVRTHVARKKHQRFAEQSWSFIYYTISFSYGIYVMYHSPWWFDTTYFWRDYPVLDYTQEFKYYYLLQFAFWLQQIFVLQIEAPRKDYRELVMHHINTLLLISLSYGCNFTRVGNAVFVCMDLPDAFLALAKSLNYMIPGYICNTTFVCMLISWMYTRVYLYGRIIWSTYTEPELYVPEFKLAPLSGHFFPWFVKYIILGLMLGLYFLILFWTAMIFKVLYKMVTDTAKDVRSDDEDEDQHIAMEHYEGHSTSTDVYRQANQRLTKANTNGKA
ncbi:TLC domain-containing protein [Radiomyces spectabilis]|uniref:TLC domain-containing protein n=1 Tax=Radiomyces spectabilis TaxID=64574 RepID=UPI002220EF93|nr:TLC domain-containing protein [Radiomyces spectabilis]KAI8365958.1 TLC domain-containing protein [Radiomyces spectabilis]